ncbi:MAG: Tol-Pal system protein TolB, partial [Sphingomonadales bacterium]|nr:Tol-Pal system protein TolB [Sphingomonadales bacterium]
MPVLLKPLFRLFALAALIAAAPALAQIEGDVVGGISNPNTIAIPDFPTPRAVDTPAGGTEAIGRQIAQVVEADLRGSGFFRPIARNLLRRVSMPQVTNPDYGAWSQVGAQYLVQG